MKLVMKGHWYYELQILMVVIMWQHNMDYKPTTIKRPSVRWGRLYIWFDSLWAYRGVAGAINYFWHDLTKNIHSFKRPKSKFMVVRINAKNMFTRWFRKLNVYNFLSSLHAYLRLYKAGFRIHNSGTSFGRNFEINRFFWAGKYQSTIIRDMCDIDCVDGKYVTLREGHTEAL